jgi:hypothetical protein
MHFPYKYVGISHIEKGRFSFATYSGDVARQHQSTTMEQGGKIENGSGVLKT